jgi:2-dehydropantoate 2-reductase
MGRDDGRERVLIAGAGALGSVVGGLLARAGWPVTLFGRPAHLDAVRHRGLRIEGLFGSHHVTTLTCATAPGELRGPYGAILLTVKAYDTAATASAVAPLLAPGGVLVSLQNGLGNLETAAAAVGAGRVLGARVIFGAEMVEPGQVRVTVYADPVLVGNPRRDDTALDQAAIRWAAHLAAAGIPAEPTREIVAELWTKVLYNAALNPLGALLAVPYGHLPADPDTRTTMDAVIEEAFTVARAAGVVLRWPQAADYRDVFYGRLVPSTAGHRSSMLQDLERGRPTEIDAINGHVAARGAELGIPTPVNATLTRLIRARARRLQGDGSPWSR